MAPHSGHLALCSEPTTARYFLGIHPPVSERGEVRALASQPCGRPFAVKVMATSRFWLASQRPVTGADVDPAV